MKPHQVESPGYFATIDVKKIGVRKFATVTSKVDKGLQVCQNLVNAIESLAMKNKWDVIYFPRANHVWLRRILVLNHYTRENIDFKNRAWCKLMEKFRKLKGLEYVPVANDWNRGYVQCPFCDVINDIYWKSFHGCGKMCPCGAYLFRGGATKKLWLL